MEQMIGAKDLPLAQGEEDLLNTQKYVDALVKFAGNCCTPMSVALQGDWGTGKTSFINRMQYALRNQEKIKTVYFNTWQYSQFNSPNDLYTSFVVCLIESLSNQLDKGTPGNFSEKAKKFVGFLVGAGLDVGRQIIDEKVGIDIKKIQTGAESLINQITQKNKTITELKNTFSSLIADVAGQDGRVIVFIDDLDRLNPEVAVALLETIKIFMDVEKCVFVLAIDYDVVVRGIRKKYGSDMDDFKCRSFFDKIIQLPFRMPTEKYVINKMLESTPVGKKIHEYTEIVCNLIKDTLGPNPRTLKRVINSFELLSLVEESEKMPYQHTLLLVSLIMQIYDEKEYSELLESVTDIEVFRGYKETKKDQVNGDTKQGDSVRDITPFFTALTEISKKSGHKEDEIVRQFIEILSLSAMTTVTSELVTTEEGKEHKVDKILLYGKEKKVATPTEAIRTTVTEIFERKQGRIDDIIKKYDKIFTFDPELKTSMFAAKSKITVGEKTFYLGIKTSYDQKLKLVRKICNDLGVAQADIKWFNGKTELLW